MKPLNLEDRTARTCEEFRARWNGATAALLRDLQKSPTDLSRLLVSALFRAAGDIVIEREAIARWERDDPRRWASVQEWLLSRGNVIVVLKSVRSAPRRP